jgi:hypothetical protein
VDCQTRNGGFVEDCGMPAGSFEGDVEVLRTGFHRMVQRALTGGVEAHDREVDALERGGFVEEVAGGAAPRQALEPVADDHARVGDAAVS